MSSSEGEAPVTKQTGKSRTYLRIPGQEDDSAYEHTGEEHDSDSKHSGEEDDATGQKSYSNSYSRAILQRGTRNTSLRHKYVTHSKGRIGGPVARFRKTGAQRGASQPHLQCLKLSKERKIQSEECASRGLN
jgi:hypothetical protein